MILTGIYRAAQLKALISDLRMKEMKINEKIADLARYSAAISDGIITPEEMSNAPASVFGRQMMYMMQSIPRAIMMGGQAFSMYMGQYGAQMQAFGRDPMMAQMMMGANPMMIQMNFIKQALETQGKQEQERLHAEEKKLQLQKGGIETRIKMAEAELQSITKTIDHETRQSAPHFGLHG